MIAGLRHVACVLVLGSLLWGCATLPPPPPPQTPVCSSCAATGTCGYDHGVKLWCKGSVGPILCRRECYYGPCCGDCKVQKWAGEQCDNDQPNCGKFWDPPGQRCKWK